jgi:hypothetical protein
MDMFTATVRIGAIARYAERTLKPRSANAVKERCQRLLDMIADGAPPAEVRHAVHWMRVEEDWPADLAGWHWFDNRLFALVEYLTEPETFPTQQELVQRLEDAILEGVLQ